jgi:HlyD family secretion protein
VTKQDAKEGEIVAANVALVSLIAERSLEIEAFIPEVDVGKVGVGDIAEVTFDAYGQDEVFSVRVVRVEPAETVVEGVATYKTIFHFVDLEAVADGRVKSGMTANIEIETARQENVLLVPLRTLRGKNGGWVAFILNAKGEAVERPVTVGLRGTEGTVEITGGLSEGDRVMATPPRE